LPVASVTLIEALLVEPSVMSLNAEIVSRSVCPLEVSTVTACPLSSSCAGVGAAAAGLAVTTRFPSRTAARGRRIRAP